MRKFIVLVIILALAVIFTPWLQPRGSAALSHQAVFVVDQYEYLANGRAQVMDAAPFVLQSRIYVPVRFLANALGVPEAGVAWEAGAGLVTLAADGVTVKLVVGSRALQVNDREISMDVAPVLTDGRVFLPARWVAEALGYEVGWDGATRAVLAGPPGNLPAPQASTTAFLPSVGTEENLKRLLNEAQARGGVYVGKAKSDELLRETAAPEAQGGTAADSAAGPADYSRTNVQVAGVDEADLVKTDGRYIYYVNRERVVIARAYPAEDMKVVKVLDFADKSLYPQELYVDDKHLVVIGHSRGYRDIPMIEPMVDGSARMAPGIVPPYHRDMVRAVVYDLGDKANVRQVRELELDGSYVSSRKIGSALYLVANRQVYYYPGREPADLKPLYRDSAASGGYMSLDYPEIKYFPGFVQPNYLVVAGVNLADSGEKARVSAYLGSGQNIYASPANLYVAVTQYHYYGLREGMPGLLPDQPASRNKTKIYKFALNNGSITYKATGEVPGTILNQFSMDEHNSYFRVATTTGEIWRSDEHTSKNNVYILDGSLNQAGKLEGIAPGEQIYSTRFVGNRAYMVTFRTVDPFFVIDLKDPRQPKILGALKIPGYSDYLHPYDENHIIGFGKDTIELGMKGPEGKGSDTMAFYTGMKMAIFDVTDVSNPVEKFKESIGDRGTDSELLHNHKALLFSREKGLLAFPVTVMEVDGSAVSPGESFPRYGKFKFQGAYVYSVDLTGGFKLKGKITHLSGEDYLRAGSYWYDSEKNVKRAMFIKDRLYTLSGKYIKANSLTDLKEINTLTVP